MQTSNKEGTTIVFRAWNAYKKEKPLDVIKQQTKCD